MPSFRRSRAAVAVATVVSTLALFTATPSSAVTGTPTAPDLTDATDSGSSKTDNITNAMTLTFAFSGATLGTGEQFQLLRNGVVVAGGSASPLSDATNATDGTYSYVIRVVDSTSATLVDSPAIAVTVDRTAPAAPVMRLTTDTGASSTDKITSTKNQSTGALSALGLTITGEPNAILTSFTRSINGGSVDARTFGGVAGATTATLSSTGTLATTDSPPIDPTFGVVQGSYTYTVKQTDVAGNGPSAAGTLAITLDTFVQILLSLDPSTDTGPSNSDRVTRFDTSSATLGANTTLKINLQSEAGAVVDLFRDGTQLLTAATVDSAGKSQYTDNGSVAPFSFTGNHSYIGRSVDVAGNVVDNFLGGALVVLVDLDNPVVPAKLDLIPASDTGTSDADDITKDDTPTFMVTGAEDDATVYVYRCPGASACTASTATTTGNRILLGTRIGNGEFTAPTTPQNNATITSWRFAVGQRDLAGRFSGGRAATVEEPATLSVHINVVIDTTPEPVPSAPTLTEGSQTGPASSSTKTSDISPTFNIAKGTGRLELLRDGTVVGTSIGAGDITDPGPLANGAYSYTVRSTDAAGNVSGGSAATTVTIENSSGYWLVATDGGVFSFGNAEFFGSTGGMTLNAPVMSMATTPKKDGYWLLARDGGVFTFGNAAFYGSTGDQVLNSPIVGMVSTPSGKGYWLFAEDGGVFTFGDAPFHGAPSSESPTSPIVAMVATSDGTGYWLVTKKGKVYAYGSAAQIAGVDDKPLNHPIVGVAATPTGSGLWLVATDGGIFALGDAPYHGSAGDIALNKPIIGMLANADGGGYLLIASDGGVFAYGNAPFLGSLGDIRLNAPIVGIAGT